MSALRCGIIGLGAMGAPMARHLAAKGFLEGVWNRTESKAEQLAVELLHLCRTRRGLGQIPFGRRQGIVQGDNERSLAQENRRARVIPNPNSSELVRRREKRSLLEVLENECNILPIRAVL